MLGFADAPFLVLWEVTRACDLACLHCRASALPDRNPLELTTAEGLSLLEDIRGLGDPLLVFTGGDPLKRPDLFDLLEHSVGLGLRTTVTPSATPLLTAGAIRRFQECGIARMAVSLDGPDPASHDGFRGVSGSFDRTLLARSADARDIGLPTQVNTTVTPGNFTRLAEIARSVERANARLWSVFFLVSTGRAQAQQDSIRRASTSRSSSTSTISRRPRRSTSKPRRRPNIAAMSHSVGRPPANLRNPAMALRPSGGKPASTTAKGCSFVSHTGEVFPSGFLPVSAGNVRRRSLADLYRDVTPVSNAARPARPRRKMRYCEYRTLCGGSRARVLSETVTIWRKISVVLISHRRCR